MMTFGTAIRTVFSKYAEFSGRASRAEFWWFILFSGLVVNALGALTWGGADGGNSVGSTLASIWGTAVLLPTLAVAVRRLRDSNSRWTQLFWILVPIAGLIVLAIRFSDPPAAFDTTNESITPA